MKEIPAITLWQPWASLLACGAKIYETRSWATKYRGSIAIHAAIKNPISLWDTLSQDFLLASYYPLFHDVHDQITTCEVWWDDAKDLPRGCIIATAELVGCNQIGLARGEPYLYRQGEREYIRGNEFLFGDWAYGRYAWEFANMKMLPEPLPAKGMQRLWKWRMPA